MGEGVRDLHGSGVNPEPAYDVNRDSMADGMADAQDHSASSPAVAASSSTKRSFRGFVWASVFLLTAIMSAGIGATLALVTPIPTRFGSQIQAKRLSLNDLWKSGLPYQVTRPVNVLIMGLDLVPEATRNSPEVLAGRTDTMMLVRLDPAHKTLNVLSIPRDTQVLMPGYGVMKINQANVIGGPSLAARVVSSNLNDVPVDRYIRVSTEAFREIVDLIGGVEVFVPEPMYYSDYTQDLHIDLAQGWQTLDGEQAEQFARFRDDSYGDIGRVQRQQQLIRALRDRLISPAIIPRIPQVIRIAQRYVDTNLSLEEMLALVNFGLQLDQEAFRMVMLPGRFSTEDEYVASYWIMDEDASERVVSEYFQPPQTSLAVLNSSDEERSPSELHIAIQNASSEPNAAYQVADYLRERGFYDVYVVGSWPDEERQTQIIVQRGDLEGAKTLESVIGFGQVVSASTGNIESDLTIRVGDDWMTHSVAPLIEQ